MTPHTSEAVAKPAASRRRRWLLFVVAILLLAGGATGAWRWWFQPTAPLVPPMPPDIPDAEVRHAVERVRQKVLNEPGNANAWGSLGMVLMAHEFLAEADSCFAEATRLQPNSANWPYARGLIALKLDPDSALPFLRTALAARNSWPEFQSAVRLRLAEALLERQELEEAERLLLEEERRQPGNPRTALGIGMVALARGDQPETAEKFLTIARSHPLSCKTATAQLAALARIRGDLEAAANYDRETAALPAAPPWPDPFRDETERMRVGHYAWLQQVSQLEDQHRFTEAAEMYKQKIKENPTGRDYARAGLNLAQSGDYEQALKYLREGVRLYPDYAHAHFNLALTLYIRADIEMKQSANSPVAKEWLRESVAHARRTAELRPTQASAYLYWGLALKALGEPAAAVVPLRQGVECLPGDFKMQLTLGEVLLESGKYQEAEIPLENARKLNPNDPRLEQALKRLPK